MVAAFVPAPVPEVGLLQAGQTEYNFMASIVCDPTQWYGVQDLTPALFEHPSYRHIYAIVYDRKGQVPPIVLHNQLEKSEAGRLALKDLGGMDGIHRLYRDGVTAGDAESLANEIRVMATTREIELIKRTILPHQFRDPGEYGAKLSARISEVVARLAGPQHGTLADSVDDAYDSWVWLQDNPGKILGVRSGLDNYDKALGGFEPGQVIVLGASSGEGKTQTQCFMALQAATLPNDVTGEPNRVVYFSLEMEKAELSRRWMSNLSRVEYYKGHAEMSARQKMMLARDRLKAFTNLLVCPPAQASTLDQILRGLRWYKDHHDVNIAFVDYAQLIRVTGSSEASRYEQMAQVSQRIKIAAQELKLAVVMSVQLNREALKGTSGRPGIHHVADSMDLVRSADVVSFLWTPDRYLAGQEVGLWRGKLVLLTGKVRHRPSLPDFVYQFEKEYSNIKMLDFNEERALRLELPNLGRERPNKTP
jgi:replicative DNA helicase